MQILRSASLRLLAPPVLLLCAACGPKLSMDGARVQVAQSLSPSSCSAISTVQGRRRHPRQGRDQPAQPRRGAERQCFGGLGDRPGRRGRPHGGPGLRLPQPAQHRGCRRPLGAGPPRGVGPHGRCPLVGQDLLGLSDVCRHLKAAHGGEVQAHGPGDASDG